MIEQLDINADLGEGFGNWVIGRDDELLPLITTANIACGFHASDPLIMEETVRRGSDLGTAMGAHPGLPDLAGFGRRRIDISLEEARALILYQVGALQAFLEVSDAPLHHVKPHGALYVMINADAKLAATVMDATADVHPGGMYYWPAPIPGTVRDAAESAGLRLVPEFYVDTRYDDEGSLLVERKKRPVDVPAAVERARRFLEDSTMESVNGKELHFEAESLCVHGDGPNAPELVAGIREALGADGVTFEAVQR